MAPIASTFMAGVMLVSMAREAHGGGPAGVWAESELVWPSDEMGLMMQAVHSASGHDAGILAWPVTMAEICRQVSEIDTAFKGTDAEAIVPILRGECQDKSLPLPFAMSVDAGAYPREGFHSLNRPFEFFTSGWGSVLVDPEIGMAWSRLPPAVKVELGYPVSPHSFLHLRLGLRRDLAAWHGDAIGLNLPLSDKEVDLNEPSLGYFHAENDRFAFTAGRFPVHWSASPEFGLALSAAVPYHNGLAFAMKMPHVRYRFLVSSLNPWLEGTPAGDLSSEDFPPGSEQYRQRNYSSERGTGVFHKRVYADNIKTLFAHRLEGNLGPFGLGLMETQVIGGKIPDLRDAGPFVVFHNDFKDGYTNGTVSMDGVFRLPAGLSVVGELYMDDVQYAKTEGEGNTASILGYLAAVRHAFSVRAWAVTHSLHAIRTDPFLYGYPLPLNTMASRHILASNFQQDGDTLFVDRYVVDYPMGYLRGGDAFDFWYRAEAWRGRRLRLSLEAALLAKGEVDLHTPYEDYYAGGHDAPTGTVEREIRLSGAAAYRLRYGWAARAGAAWQGIRNRDHRSGEDDQRFQVSAAVSWTRPP